MNSLARALSRYTCKPGNGVLAWKSARRVWPEERAAAGMSANTKFWYSRTALNRIPSPGSFALSPEKRSSSSHASFFIRLPVHDDRIAGYKARKQCTTCCTLHG